MSDDAPTRGTVKRCGMYELVLFISAVIAGSACSICSKTMMELRGTGITGETEIFTKPLFQTFGMFVGMTFGLVMHGIVVLCRIPFPGYDHGSSSSNTTNASTNVETSSLLNSKNGGAGYGSAEAVQHQQQMKSIAPTPLWMYFFLIIPAIFDLAATAFCMVGLQYIDVSVYQLLRGSGIIFVALMKQHVLKDHLFKFQWIGVLWNLVSVLLVGMTAILNTSEDDEAAETPKSSKALLGVLLVMIGAFVQALQFVFEEKVMNMEEASASPLVLIGMEGLWGTILCVFVLYPLAYYLPGDDHGSFEDPYNTWYMIRESATISNAFVVYFVAIFAYNLLSVLVTFSLSSVWHAILDNFRPIMVWGADMFIYYGIVSLEKQFGEAWTSHSYIQLIGMFVLLYGTAIYNAPNAGCIKLQGQWYAFGIDMSVEYDQLDDDEASDSDDAEDDEYWKSKLNTFKERKASSFAEISPYVSNVVQKQQLQQQQQQNQ